MTNFDGKSVLVTGAGSGIGFEICKQFAALGARVGLNDVDRELAISSGTKIKKSVGTDNVLAVPFDVCDIKAAGDAITSFAKNGLDIFIANAGITVFAPFLDISEDRFERLLDVNLKGTFFTCQTAAKQMITSKTAGRIVLISSVVGIQAHENLSVYGMSKAGIRMLAKTMAAELGAHGINVNAVAPGATLSERTMGDDPNYAAGWAAAVPNRRVGLPEDVAATVLFLSGAGAAHITGEVITIDGGWTVTSPLPEHL